MRHISWVLECSNNWNLPLTPFKNRGNDACFSGKLQGLSQNWYSLSPNDLVTPSIGILIKHTYSVVHYVSNKYLQTAVCKIDLKLQQVVWKQLRVPLQLAIHYSRNKFFGEKIRFDETNWRTTNSILHTIRLFVVCFRWKLFCCKSTNISSEFRQKTASPAKPWWNTTKNRFAKMTNNHLRTIRISPTFCRFVVIRK